MSAKKSIIRTFLFAAVAMLAFSSCNKCVVGDDSYSGTIHEFDPAGSGGTVIIYPKIGYMTQTMEYNNWHVNAQSPYASEFEISFDGGNTRHEYTNVSSSYDIVGLPMTVYCKASFARQFNPVSAFQQYEYKVTAETCKSCENKRYIENWVLVDKVPTGWGVTFKGTINEE